MSSPAKLTVGSTFGIYPPRGGGQLRIFNLYRHLAERCPVDVIALVAGDELAVEREIAPGLREVRIPKTREHAAAESELEYRAAFPVTDVAFPELHALTPHFGDAIRASALPGGVLVASHPYALSALRAANRDCPLWYDAHNVELDLKAAMLPDNPTARRMLAATRAVEQACCEQAEFVLASSAEDADRLRALYRLEPRRVTVVPNGVNAEAIRFTSPTERRQLWTRLRMERPVALFIGSWHEPNVLAVRRILTVAPQLPNVTFAIVGSVGIPFRDLRLPANVELWGIVGDELKETLLSVAAVALNPVSEGSGTNMKMLDYLAAGVPVVSTAVGARGLDLELETAVRIVPLADFHTAVQAVLDEHPTVADVRASEVRRQIEQRLDWAAVARQLLVATGAEQTPIEVAMEPTSVSRPVSAP